MLQPIQLFKILSDETRLAIVMILQSRENYASVISAQPFPNRSPKSRDIWLFFARLGWF